MSYLLITKFDKDKKIGYSDFLFQIFWFWWFQTQTAKIEDLKIKRSLSLKKEGNALKDQNKRNSS
jgi:hypothetical protein